MRLGVLILPEHRWPVARKLWRRAEELGFDHAWTYDHLAWRSLRDEPWFGAIPTLTAAALATERIRLGPLVASPAFRHPVPFAKELMTLDDISGGRLTLGLGAGSEGWDSTMLGQAAWSRRERVERFGEFAELLDRLLRTPAMSYEGRYYSADEARMLPGCVQQPRVPFVVAATGPRSMRVVAQHAQTWVTSGDPTRPGPFDPVESCAIVSEQMKRLDEACGTVGRDPATLGRMVVVGLRLAAGLGSPESFQDTIGRYAELGITDLVVHWPRREEPYALDPVRFEQVVTSVRTP